MGLFGKSEPETASVNGKALACVVCANGEFTRKEAVMHDGLASFMNIEWASPKATLLICSACGYVHWFLPDGR
jgi:predicted nucleic-acid-binding Zn-ribbon protein